MLRKTSLYLYLAIVFSGCLNQREEYALYGHVKDQAGLPIKDVKVSVPKDEISAVTDEFGYYIMSEEQFDPLFLGEIFSPGTKIEVKAEKGGYASHVATIEFSEKAKQYDIVLTP